MKVKRKRIALCVIVAALIAAAVIIVVTDDGKNKRRTSEDLLKSDLFDMISIVYAERCWFDPGYGCDYGREHKVSFDVYKSEGMYIANVRFNTLDTLGFTLSDNELVYCGEVDADIDDLEVWYSDEFVHKHLPPEYEEIYTDEFGETFIESGLREHIGKMYADSEQAYKDAWLVFLNRYEWDYSSFYRFDDEAMGNPDAVYHTYLIIYDDNYSYTLYDGIVYEDDDGKLNYKQTGKWNATGYYDAEFEKMGRLSFAGYHCVIDLNMGES